MEVALENIRQAEGITEDILPLKELMERRFNLSRQVSGDKQLVFTRKCKNDTSSMINQNKTVDPFLKNYTAM